MRKRMDCVAALTASVAILALMRGGRPEAIAADSDEPMLAHNVYFALKDNSAENRKKLIEGCEKHLASIDGIAFFACGAVNDDLKRDVNVRDWDVGLHIVFKNKAAHDRYQPNPHHQAFANEYKGMFKSVRVFDSDVRVTPSRRAG